MVIKDEYGRKNYKQPMLKVVMISTADIIATSGDTNGEVPDAPFED